MERALMVETPLGGVPQAALTDFHEGRDKELDVTRKSTSFMPERAPVGRKGFFSPRADDSPDAPIPFA
jgi:hypothetical protein